MMVLQLTRFLWVGLTTLGAFCAFRPPWVQGYCLQCLVFRGFRSWGFGFLGFGFGFWGHFIYGRDYKGILAPIATTSTLPLNFGMLRIRFFI